MSKFEPNFRCVVFPRIFLIEFLFVFFSRGKNSLPFKEKFWFFFLRFCRAFFFWIRDFVSGSKKISANFFRKIFLLFTSSKNEISRSNSIFICECRIRCFLALKKFLFNDRSKFQTTFPNTWSWDLKNLLFSAINSPWRELSAMNSLNQSERS